MRASSFAILALWVGGCTRESAPSAQSASAAQSAPAPAPSPEAGDSAIVEQRLALALSQQLDTLPLGEIVVRIGRTFVGAPYTPGTLEPPGPERLVINLREFDCVTFVENTLALARVTRAGTGGFPAFKQELRRIRYRDGKINGYPSRLHYFSEWISNNQSKGVVRDVTRSLGGVRDPEPIRFMTEHVSAYRQLSAASVLGEIKRMEQRLNQGTRYMIREEAIATAAGQIRNGDVIAATTDIAGLDVAHTGIALWVDGKLHLMHAPLVGSVVEISEVPLAQRIRALDQQDGIMVARPL